VSTQITVQTRVALLRVDEAIDRELGYLTPFWESKTKETKSINREIEAYEALPWWKRIFANSPYPSHRYPCMREYRPDLSNYESLLRLRTALSHHESGMISIGVHDASLLFEPKSK
jgi:hypothetical protein